MAITSSFNLAQAARLGNTTRRYSLTYNANYPNDNFSIVGGAHNTSLGYPPILLDYYRNPGELQDINGVAVFSNGANAICANIPAVAAITGAVWFTGRVRADELKVNPWSGSATAAGILQIDSDGAGTNKKFEVYFIHDSTSTFGIRGASYTSGSVRINVAGTPDVSMSALPPSGCFVNWAVGIDPVAGTLTAQITDDGGVPIADSTHVARSVTTGFGGLLASAGSNGRVTLNSAFNGAARSVNLCHAGLSINAGKMPPHRVYRLYGNRLHRAQPIG